MPLPHFTRQPRKLFLIDCMGAMLTTILLFGVLRTYHEYIGLPKAVLSWLPAISLVFSIYSMACYFLAGSRWRLLLRIIGTANLLYCLLTLVLVVYHFQNLSWIGIAYFVGEMAVIGVLVYVEFGVAGMREAEWL